MYHNKNTNNKINFDLLIWCLVLAVLAAIAVGAIGDEPILVAADEDIETMAVSKDVSGDKTIQSLNFKKGVKIQDALRFLALRYDKNIVPSPKIDGQLAFTKLSNVTFKEAMEAILGVNLKYKVEGQLIKVYTADEYKTVMEDKERMVQKVFTLYYINAAEIKKLISPALSSSAIVAASTAAETDTEAGDGGDTLAMHDTVSVYDYPENIEMVSQMINEIDVKPSEILIEVTILEAQLKWPTVCRRRN